MKLTRAFSLLSVALIFGACYVDVYEIGNSSSATAYYSEGNPINYYSSSSLEINKDAKDSLIYQKSYATIKIGSQTWMAQNLNEAPKTGKGNWWCPGDYDPDLLPLYENCRIYGRLYDWEAAKDACPDSLGWRLPSYDDFKYLSDYLSGRDDIIQSPAWWNATYSGYRDEDTGDYRMTNSRGNWWSSTDAGHGQAYYSYVEKGTGFYLNLSENKARGFSVRCVK